MLNNSLDPIIADTFQRLHLTSSAPEELEAQARRIPDYKDLQGYHRFRTAAGMSDEQSSHFLKAGILLQPKQLEFAVAARTCDNEAGPEEIGMGGTKGPGKSFAVFAQTTIDDMQRFPGLKCLYLRNTAKSATEQLEDMARYVLRHIPTADIKQGRIDFANGSRMIIGGFNNDTDAIKYLGIEYDIIIVEEATQLSATAHAAIRMSNRSSKIHPQTKVAWRPRRYYTTNPLGIGHAWFKKRFVDNELARRRGDVYDPRYRFIPALPDDNAFINKEYLTILDELGPAQYRAYRLGDWSVSAGAYFENFSEQVHVIRPFYDLSWMRSVWAAMDFGFQHPQCILLCGEDPDGNIYVLDELVHRRVHPQDVVPDLLHWLGKYDYTPQQLDHFLVGLDAFAETGVAKYSVAQQYALLGITLSRAYSRPGSRIAGAIELSKRLGDPPRIEPRIYFSSNCRRLIQTIPFLERDPNNPEDVKKINSDEQGDGGDDPYDALRYAIYKPHVTVMS